MKRLEPGVEAALLGGLEHRLAGAHAVAFGDERRQSRIARRQFGGHRMAGRDRAERRAVERVGPGGEDFKRAIAALQREENARAFGSPDPIFLHHAHALGPALERPQPVEELVGKLGDLQEPLREQALFHERARAPPAAVDHLLVREHAGLNGVPIDPGFLAISEALRQEIEEHLLLVTVILRMAGRDLAPPVIGKPHPNQLLAHHRDVLQRPGRGVDLARDRRILGGQAKRVPSHRMQYVVPLSALEARDDVAHRVVADMADMERAGRIGKHLQHVIFRPARIGLDVKHAAVAPYRLPLLLGLLRVVTRHGAKATRCLGLSVGRADYFATVDMRSSRARARIAFSMSVPVV